MPLKPPAPRFDLPSCTIKLRRTSPPIHCLRRNPLPQPRTASFPHRRCLSTSSHLRNSNPNASSSSASQDSYPTPPPPRPPRWAHTPQRMTAPVTLNKRSSRSGFAVNESRETLDKFYARFLGEGGESMLTDEVKWLAVTHKSFDQGRRGYNDRLAFLGKRLVNLQTCLLLLNRSDGGPRYDPPDEYDREPFRHPGIDLLPRLTEEEKGSLTHKARIATFAQRRGLLGVLRWTPRDPFDLNASGVDQALSQALYAIVGAVALQRGGEVAVRVVKDRILGQMDLS